MKLVFCLFIVVLIKHNIDKKKKKKWIFNNILIYVLFKYYNAIDQLMKVACNRNELKKCIETFITIIN